MTRRALQHIQGPLSSFPASLTPSAAAAKHCPECKRPWRRQFSSTRSCEMTKLRFDMFNWLNNRGKNFLEPVQGKTNYLTDYDKRGFRQYKESDAAGERANSTEREKGTREEPKRPFPLNEHFFSQPILSEELREEIWRRVKVDKKSIRNVSVELGVEMRRVGAVVRLVELEKQWRAEVSGRSPLLLHVSVYYDEQHKNRLVFQTYSMVIFYSKLQLSEPKHLRVKQNVQSFCTTTLIIYLDRTSLLHFPTPKPFTPWFLLHLSKIPPYRMKPSTTFPSTA